LGLAIPSGALVATGAWSVNRLLVVGALTRYRPEGRMIHQLAPAMPFSCGQSLVRVWKGSVRIRNFCSRVRWMLGGFHSRRLSIQSTKILDVESNVSYVVWGQGEPSS